MKKRKSPIKKYDPHPRLKAYIQSFWILIDSDNYLLGDFCKMDLEPCLELVFNLSKPITCIVGDSFSTTIRGDFIIGSLVRQIQIRPSGSMFLFGVQFTPEGLYPFLSMLPVDLSDICVEFEEVWELNQLGSSNLIHSTNPKAENLIQTFEDFFSRRMDDFRTKHGLSVEKAVSIIRSHKGQIPVKTLANRLKISSRHLERQVSFAVLNEQFGLKADQTIPALMLFAGGIAGNGETCGAVTGSLLAIGFYFEPTNHEEIKKKVFPVNMEDFFLIVL